MPFSGQHLGTNHQIPACLAPPTLFRSPVLVPGQNNNGAVIPAPVPSFGVETKINVKEPERTGPKAQQRRADSAQGHVPRPRRSRTPFSLDLDLDPARQRLTCSAGTRRRFERFCCSFLNKSSLRRPEGARGVHGEADPDSQPREMHLARRWNIPVIPRCKYRTPWRPGAPLLSWNRRLSPLTLASARRAPLEKIPNPKVDRGSGMCLPPSF